MLTAESEATEQSLSSSPCLSSHHKYNNFHTSLQQPLPPNLLSLKRREHKLSLSLSLEREEENRAERRVNSIPQWTQHHHNSSTAESILYSALPIPTATTTSLSVAVVLTVSPLSPPILNQLQSLPSTVLLQGLRLPNLSTVSLGELVMFPRRLRE